MFASSDIAAVLVLVQNNDVVIANAVRQLLCNTGFEMSVCVCPCVRVCVCVLPLHKSTHCAIIGPFNVRFISMTSL